MQSQANPEPILATENRFLRKARILMDLFGPAGVQRLRQAGLPENLSLALDQLETTAGDTGKDQAGQTDLIERFRRLGVFSPDASLPAKESDAEQAPDLNGRAALLDRIARHLIRDQLGEEHPAVIALVLRSQSRDMQTRVLKALPGVTARATIRYLKA